MPGTHRDGGADAGSNSVSPHNDGSSSFDVIGVSTPEDGGAVRGDGPASSTDVSAPVQDAGAPDADARAPLDASTDADASKGPVARRLPLPCVAPLPTGFCLQSDVGDYIGQGKTYFGQGPTSVTLTPSSSNKIELHIQDTRADSGGSYSWDANFAPAAGGLLVPGLFDPAQRYPFQAGSFAGLSIYGNGSGCNTVTGKFSIEELARDPAAGITRLSVTFEQHCEGGTAALRGVINFQATGAPEPTPGPDKVINLNGKIFPASCLRSQVQRGIGLDATNRRLAKIDLTSGSATYANVVCRSERRLRRRQAGTPVRGEQGQHPHHRIQHDQYQAVRNITWAGIDWGPADTTFEIHCAADRLYVVDGAWAPGLFTVDGLDTANPVVTDHTAQISGVGNLVLNATASDLYYWYQYE